MKLTVKDHLLLLNVLPPTGDMTMLKIVRELLEAFSIKEAERKKLSFKSEIIEDEHGRRISHTWNIGKDRPVEIPIGDTAFEMIMTEFTKLDNQKKLTLDTLELYERFLAFRAKKKC